MGAGWACLVLAVRWDTYGMSSNAQAGNEPINLAERRSARDQNAGATPLTTGQQRAYRQLAIFALGLDLPTLTRELRARRLQRMPEVLVVPTIDRAA